MKRRSMNRKLLSALCITLGLLLNDMVTTQASSGQIDAQGLAYLKTVITPNVYNGLEQLIGNEACQARVNVEAPEDVTAELGAMIGTAVTVQIRPSQGKSAAEQQAAWLDYWAYLASVPGPKVVVVQDLDEPCQAAFWGDVNAHIHLSLGCVGSIIDGAVRDVPEVLPTGFKVLARRRVVGHADSSPVSWGKPVTVFGRLVQPGQLIHADQHGFLLIPDAAAAALPHAVATKAKLEQEIFLPGAKRYDGESAEDFIKRLDATFENFRTACKSAIPRIDLNE